MNPIILRDFDFSVPTDTLLEKCHAEEGEEEGNRILELYHIANQIGRPKVLLREAAILDVDPDTVSVGGVLIHSPFVREKLLQTPYAYPYVVTCGTEIEKWSQSLEDLVDQFYMDELKKLWLGPAIQALHQYVHNQFPPETKFASVNPGSLALWPIQGQHQLFQILGDVSAAIGVHLTDSSLMLPSKSASGILFPDQTGHVNCSLCPRDNCPNRRAPRK